jgi:hypothetical protein
MPIPMPLPPAPYVAPDLHPIVTQDVARLTFVRDQRGILRELSLDAGTWIAAEGAPLEVRVHRRSDGTFWAEQATYSGGDRMDGIARASAAAHTEVLSRKLASRFGSVQNAVRFTISDASGTDLRTWTAQQCGTGDVARLDRADSPSEPTFPSSYEFCGGFFATRGGIGLGLGIGGPYALGRVFGLDRGWAMRASTQPPLLKSLADGRYRLTVQVDPLEGLADADRSNNSVTVPLQVRSAVTRRAVPEPGVVAPTPGPATVVARSAGPGGDPTQLAEVEHEVDAQIAARGMAKLDTPAGFDLPDLRQAPSYGIATQSRRLRSGRRDELMFGSLTWNAGPGKLEVEAFRERGQTLQAYQVFYRDGDRAGREQRGTMVWHAGVGHNHFHFHSFAHYQLTRMDGSVVQDAGKHSWCIVDTDVVDTTLPGVEAGSSDAFGIGGCGMDPGSLWARLSLSVGSGDYYGPGTSGQTIDITHVPNGLYRIRLEANPSRVIAESDYENNVSTRIIRLGGVPGARLVFPRPVPTVDDSGFGGDCEDC